jgi:hypothetical protein
MPNPALFAAARAVAYAVTHEPDFVQLMYNANHAVLQQILNDLAIFSQYKWQDKVARAAVEGLTFTTIYRYFSDDRFQGFPTSLLINGPPGDPGFFVRNGYISVVVQLQTAMAPGIVSNYYSGKNKGSRIMLNWT